MQCLGDLCRRVAVIQEPQRLVVDKLVHVALRLEQLGDARLTCDRPGVLADHDISPVAEGIECLADVARPQIAVAHLRAAYRVEVVHGVVHVLGHVEHAELREINQHLGRRLRARRHVEGDLDAVDGARLVALDRRGRRNQAERRAADRLAEAGVDMAARAGRQNDAELVLRAPTHGAAGQHDLARHGLGETRWRQHLDLARRHVALAGHSPGAAEMVGVTVRIDHGADRLLGPMLVIEIEGGARRVGAAQGVDEDQARVALDDRHVGRCRSHAPGRRAQSP